MTKARPACWREVDYVLIDHGDGTSGLYLHLRPGSVLVRSGDVVTVGQPLAQAGASGWTDRSGLQFQVQSTPVWDSRQRARLVHDRVAGGRLCRR